MTKKEKQPAPDLPKGVLASDRKYPERKGDEPWTPITDMTFYKTGRFGWCVATLSINNRGRTYGITEDGRVVTMGGRPDDVTVHVYLHEGNRERLKRYVDLKEKGLATAGDVRDRIGSRRAQGQVMRSQGRTSWRWDS